MPQSLIRLPRVVPSSVSTISPQPTFQTNVRTDDVLTFTAVQIDNEYNANPEAKAYFAQLEEKYLAGGIVVPLTYNDPGEGKNFVNGTGSVDLYGLDSYPQLFDCSNPEKWNPVQLYHSYHEQTDPGEPFYFPEFQGGSFDAWGPTAPGYANCAELTGATFESVFYRGLWASNAKMLSFYMVYGYV